MKGASDTGSDSPTGGRRPPPSDPLMFVQFPHPGSEHKPGGLVIDWNTGAHARKFLRGSGRYVERGIVRSGTLVFWGEWEPQSRIVEAFDDVAGGRPRWLHEPFWQTPSDTRSLQNTDPLVFGDRFLYSNCRQHRNRKLRHLSPGSIVLFGSKLQREFVLDTVFVVGDDSEDYTLGSSRARPLRGLGPDGGLRAAAQVKRTPRGVAPALPRQTVRRRPSGTVQLRSVPPMRRRSVRLPAAANPPGPPLDRAEPRDGCQADPGEPCRAERSLGPDRAPSGRCCRPRPRRAPRRTLSSALTGERMRSGAAGVETGAPFPSARTRTISPWCAESRAQLDARTLVVGRQRAD